MARILLIEADRQLAGYVAGYLRRRGYDVLRCSNLQNAITAADTNSPQIIVLNLSLAGRSGIEFLYELRSYSDWQSIPVIVSGLLSPEERAAYATAFAQLGVSSYLSKSATSLQELEATLEKLLQTTAA